MPIQNIGTLLENMVVTETVSVMLDEVESNQRLGFATSFAMPTLSEWRPHPQAVGMSTAALKEIAKGHTDTDFLSAMSRCLSHTPDRGPNGALLAGVLATLRGSGLSVWANDIPDGHYGNAIPSLEKIVTLVRRILPGSKPDISVKVCDRPYPWSLDNLNRSAQVLNRCNCVRDDVRMHSTQHSIDRDVFVISGG
jgi:hypothetical protein